MKYLSLFILLISINSGAASIGILNCSDQNPIYLYSNIEVTKSKIIARGNKIYSREEYDKSLLEECPLFYYSLEACDTDGDVDCDLSGYKWEKRARQTNIISIKLGGNGVWMCGNNSSFEGLSIEQFLDTKSILISETYWGEFQVPSKKCINAQELIGAHL